MELRVRHYKALERLFAAECSGRLPLQSKAKVYQELADMKLADRCSTKFGYGSLAVKVEGWALTPLGNLTYCESADDKQDDACAGHGT